jgi:hypothetical protein
MFAQGNFVQNVLKKDGADIQSAVSIPSTLFGFAAKIVFPPNTCVDFQSKTLNNSIGNNFLFTELEVFFFSVLIVVEKFQGLRLQISKIMSPYVKKGSGSDQKWTEMIERCDTVDFYSDAVTETFSDQNYNFGRMYVLTIFTENVCRKRPEIADKIKSIYMEFIRRIK